MASISNLTIDQGTTYTVSISVNDDTGSARNLTGYTGRSQMRRSYYSSSNTSFTVTIPSTTLSTVNVLELTNSRSYT